jgi:hypothetical protein
VDDIQTSSTVNIDLTMPLRAGTLENKHRMAPVSPVVPSVGCRRSFV